MILVSNDAQFVHEHDETQKFWNLGVRLDKMRDTC